MKTISFILLALFSFLASCEYEANLTYAIKNNSSSSIKIVFTNTKTLKDGTETISPASEKAIAIIGQGLSGVEEYKEKDANLRSFSKMDIYKNDTIKAKTDFLKTDRWEYTATSKHSADYLATVTDSDF